MSEHVLSELHDSVAVITLNEPDRLNPFSDYMRADVLTALQTAMDDPAVRVIVLTGAGGNFSAGADVRQMAGAQGPDPARSTRRLRPLLRIVETVASGPKPVIAAVEGAAFGAGLSVAAASDYVVAAQGARFGAAFAKIGLTADCGLLWSLPQRIGLSKARDLMFTGKSLDADQALALGLADRVTDKGGAVAAALEKAKEYLASAPLSIAAIKSAIARGPAPLLDVLSLEMVQQPMLSMTQDHAEGRLAFSEKRAPKFEGR